MHLKHAVNGTSDSALKKIQAVQNLGSQFLEIAQLSFNSKCDENMFRLCRLPLFSLSLSITWLLFWRSGYRLLNPSFISLDVTPGARRALCEIFRKRFCESRIIPVCLSEGLSLGLKPGILGTMVQFAFLSS